MKPTPGTFLHLGAALCAAGWIALPAQAVEKDKKARPAQEEADDAGEEKDSEEEKKKTVEELTKGAAKLAGLFTVYRDPVKGSVYLEIRKSQIGREFIYFTHTRNGIPALGHFRGNFHDSQVFRIERNFERIEFVAENTAFYFDRKNPLSRAAEANISRAVLASEAIAAEDEKRGTVLIDAGKIFLTEALHKVSPGKDPDDDEKQKEKELTLGSLSKEKTKFLDLRNYPQNTVFVVEYVYDNPDPKGEEEPEVTDPRYVSIELQHTLIQMPRNGYAPRPDDPRVGFFTKEVTDLTSPSPTPYRDVIERWHLVKKDPNAELSEPVEPITWWIENTTPIELRPTIQEAALLWNEAFEKAGFVNALVVKTQPDDADWDAGDIRYNVLRWTSSPSPPFGGYGPSFINPRTGQILGADIMLEYVFLSNRLRTGDVFETAALSRYAHQPEAGDRARGCRLGSCMHQNNLFGIQALRARGGSSAIRVDALLKESLHYLVLHEIGHTLGLMHNMRASQLHGLDSIHDRDKTAKEGLVASVMDYPMVNFAPKGGKQGQYYQTRPGPYDLWAIEYGYSSALPNRKAEADRLEAILARSSEPALAFGNDADDMRSPGSGLDPRIMVGDLSSDAIGYAAQRCDLVRDLLGGLLTNAVEEGESYHRVRDAYLILTGHYDDAVTAISRYIGGVYVDRSFAGQAGAGVPFTPVPEADQRRAMEALDQYLFSADAFAAEGRLYAYLQPQRRGFNFFDEREEPGVHGRVNEMQKAVLDQLLHRRTLERIVDSELYGCDYTLAEVLGDLTDRICRGDGAEGPNSFRRQLQSRYVERLIDLGGLEDDSSYADNAKSIAFFELSRMETIFGEPSAPDAGAAERAHRDFMVHRIRKAMEED